MKKLLFFTCSILLCFKIYSAPVEVTILFTNDTNGHPLSFIQNESPDQGGIPARAMLLKNISGDRKKDNVLILDTDGVLMGRPESNIFQEFRILQE